MATQSAAAPREAAGVVLMPVEQVGAQPLVLTRGSPAPAPERAGHSAAEVLGEQRRDRVTDLR